MVWFKGHVAESAPAGWLSAPAVVESARQSRFTIVRGTGDTASARRSNIYSVTVQAQLPSGPVTLSGRLAIPEIIKAGQRTAIFYDPAKPTRRWKLDRWATNAGFGEWVSTPEALAESKRLMPEAMRRELFGDETD